jgi:protocatechuate 3,4-dioxygenase beta subunit
MGVIRSCLLLSLATVALVALAAGAPGGVAAEVTCSAIASPSGSDSSGLGTVASPVATAQRLLESLSSGQTGCFRGGTYAFSLLNVTKPDVTLAPYGSEAVTLKGPIKVLPTGTGAVIEGMKLDGVNSNVNCTGTCGGGSPRIYADGVALRHNEITNEHSGICVLINRFYSEAAPRDVVVEDNRIHDCGRLPATNHDHGVYDEASIDAVIRDNWIYDNADRGVQLYPDAQRTTVTGNVIDGNGEGIVFSGAGTSVSDHNLVQGNIISNSELRWNVYSGSDGPIATENLLKNNCVWASGPSYDAHGGVETPSRNFTAVGNVVDKPQFVDPGAGDFRLQRDSPCLSAVTDGTPGNGHPQPPTASPDARKVRLRASKRAVSRGERFRLEGRVVDAAPAGVSSAMIQVPRHGRWRTIHRERLGRGARFGARVRAKAHAHRLRFRAKVRAVGHSRVVRVRVTR